MSKVWLEAGEIVMSGGKVTDCDACPCDTGTGTQVAVDCCGCLSMPQTWKITVAGITNQDCADCANANGTFNLVYPGTGCTWNSSTFNTLCAATGQWSLYCVSGTTWQLDLLSAGNPIASWTKAGFACLSSNVMTLSFSTTNCAGWPATITVDPV